MKCPKCHGLMRTHTRGNIHIEQCEGCRGIFLDYGEIEALTQIQNQWVQQMPNSTHVAPPPPIQPMQPAWGGHTQQHYQQNQHYYKKRGFLGMLFSS